MLDFLNNKVSKKWLCLLGSFHVYITKSKLSKFNYAIRFAYKLSLSVHYIDILKHIKRVYLTGSIRARDYSAEIQIVKKDTIKDIIGDFGSDLLINSAHLEEYLTILDYSNKNNLQDINTFIQLCIIIDIFNSKYILSYAGHKGKRINTSIVCKDLLKTNLSIEDKKFLIHTLNTYEAQNSTLLHK